MKTLGRLRRSSDRSPVGHRALVVLALLFAARVAIQFVQRVTPVGWLPDFEQWQSGSVPYWTLGIMQIMILAGMAFITVGRRSVGRRWLPSVHTVGVLYFAAMVVRLILGLTIARGHGFLDRPLPSIFHLVLATFVITWAQVSRP